MMMPNWIKNIIYALTIMGLAYFIFLKWDTIQELGEISVGSLIALIILCLTMNLINAVSFRVSMKIFQLNLRFNEWFGLATINTMYNFLLPAKAGFAIRGIYLRKKHGFEYARYVSLMGGGFILLFLTSSLLCLTFGYQYYLSDKISPLLYYFLMLAFIGSVTLIILFFKLNPNRIRGDGKIAGFIRRSCQGLQSYAQKPKLLLGIIGLQILALFINGLRIIVVYKAFQVNVDFEAALFVQGLISMSLIISITPGNLGIREGIIGVSAFLLGTTIEKAIFIALIDRLILSLLIFLMGVIFTRLLLHPKSSPKTY